MWRYIPVTVALGKLTQEDGKLQACLGYTIERERRGKRWREKGRVGGWTEGGTERGREGGLGTERRLNVFSA